MSSSLFPVEDIFSPEFAIQELNEHSKLIIKKAGITEKEFISLFNKLKAYVKFIPKKNYSEFMKKAEEISPDKDDSHFLALCFKLNLPLWSNDKELKNQDKIVILNTRDIIELYF